MVAEGVRKMRVKKPVMVRDCMVKKGYRQGKSGSLPDVDIDFQSDRRQEVKEYLERRYNHDGLQRVFSAGTFTTLKLKAVLKDVARVYGVPVNEVNYITAMIEDDSLDWSGFFQLVYSKKRLKEFVQQYPKVIESMRTLMGQPRSSSVHASAIIITPDKKDGKTMECFDYLPIKKVDDMLVSEIDGYSIDEIGLLKNDCLGIKELERIQNTRALVVKEYGDETTFLQIINEKLADPKAYKLFADGYTQNIFQFSSAGMTKFVMDMKPTDINDLIAANALFRPATIEVGSTDKYVRCKKGEVIPEYLWGTYHVLKDTFAQLTYQEQVASIAREVGGFSLVDGVHLVKFISKKKVDKIHAMKDKFMEGAKVKGCPDDQAKAIWEMFESAGSYLFNKCISGKERLLDGNGMPFPLTIAQMYSTMNYREYADRKGIMFQNIRNTYKTRGYGMCVSIDNDHHAVVNGIVDIKYSGYRPLYRITLDNGATIDVTANHKHPTQDGIKRTDELKVGEDSMYAFDSFQGRFSLVPTLYKVVSIEATVMEDVYDVTMADPYHNFATGNGVVTCNSHATAYALTAYIGAWYKANYPTAFYTVALKYAKDENIPTLMYEMTQASKCQVVSPDINISGLDFETDFKTDKIFWALSRIKFVGVETVRMIVEERQANGDYMGVADFCERMNRIRKERADDEEAERAPINSRQIKNLIIAGCFDNIEHVTSPSQRFDLLKTAADRYGFEIDDAAFPSYKVTQDFFWSTMQIAASGIGSVDYDTAFERSMYKPKYKGKSYRRISECRDMDNDGDRVVICASVAEVVEKSYTDKATGDKKSFYKITLQQNNDTMEMLVWNEDVEKFHDILVSAEGHIIIVYGIVKWSDFSNCTVLQIFKSSTINML